MRMVRITIIRTIYNCAHTCYIYCLNTLALFIQFLPIILRHHLPLRYVCYSQALNAFNQATTNTDNRTCNIGSLLTSQKSNNASVFMRLPISPYWNAVYTFLSHLFYRAIFPLGLSLIESAYTLGRNTPW